MATVQGPGKTAPKLLADFLLFDPAKNGVGNILAHHPPPVGDGASPQPHRDACRHDYTAKINQCVLPPLDARPDTSSQYKLAVICKKCRLHADIRINYQPATSPCPNADNPLHHFQRDGPEDISSSHIRYGWQCSSPTCQALLRITFRLPKVSSADRMLLTDTSKLKSRYDAVVQDDPEREGIKLASPADALTRLRRYIKDALKPDHDKRVFPGNNKRFMEAFGLYGQDCLQLLQKLGFEYNSEGKTWTLPNPPIIHDRLDPNGGLREYLEDVEMELLALTFRAAAEMNVVNPAAGEGWTSAQNELERVLAMQGYPKLTSLRRTNASNELEAYFASLGTLSDFPDHLIEFAYDRQTKCDALNEPYYYECLQLISKQRGSEDLQIKGAIMESKGLVSRRDLSEAYKYFGLPPDGGQADDDRILNIFQAQHADLGVQGQEQAREMLGRIGKQRGSKKLTNAAQQTIETLEEAYAWLGSGLDASTDDAFVVTVFTIRTEGNKDLEEVGRKAVSIIARERKSNYLNSWLSGDDPDTTSMNVDEALRLLGVDNKLEGIDATLWPQIFQAARADKPSEQTERAISAVEQALAGPSQGANGMRDPETWPVGLVSHGNTCYLNSLLQYYFSLKPLRDIVIDYDQYRMDTAKSQDKLERVGQRRVSTKEIQGGQKFADELRHLFERMIKDRGPAVKPEQDLVCRAFLDPHDFAELEEQRKASENAIDDTAAPDTAMNGVEGDKQEPDAGKSDASSVTLKGEEEGEKEDVKMNGAEMPLTPPASPGLRPAHQQTNGPAPPPLPPRRFSTTTSDTLRQAQEKAREQQDVTEVHDSITQRLRAGMLPKGADSRGEQVDALRDLFAIGMTQTTLSETTHSKPEKISDSSIQLNVPTEPSDLYSALDDYFDPQFVTEGSEKQQYRSIMNLPPLIQINMPRIGFDKVKNQAFKSDASLRLEDELYLDRYFEGNESSVLERRRSAWGWRKKLMELKMEQKALKGTAVGLDGPAAVCETARYIKNLESVNADLQAVGEDPIEADAEIHTALEADAATLTQRLRALDSEINSLQANLTGTFDDLRDKKYRLYAVFFHRGGSSHGHYWVSIHDFRNDVWRNYNDESVTEVPKDKLQNIFEARTWHDGTPTYAVYVRDDLRVDYVQAVSRSPEETPPAPQDDWQDVNMADAPARQPNGGHGTINPQVLTEGGGDQAWDKPRNVADAKCQAVPDLIPDLPEWFDGSAFPLDLGGEERASMEGLNILGQVLPTIYDDQGVDMDGFDYNAEQMAIANSLSPLQRLPERKRDPSGSGDHSPPKRVKLPGIGYLNLPPPRRD